ncbi:MAG TPA: 3-dehydroquinate synthase [Cyclobacteriaceae bacterium]|nr:3-dehydroquinate synthase [Cyclobacteriaceae bacterium]
MTQIKISSAFSFPKNLLAKYTKIGVLVDDNTIVVCYPRLKQDLPAHELIQVPSGEVHKTLKTCEHIWQRMTDHGFDRHSLLIVLGGGVLGDMGGFCAATYKRGIDFVLVPTTLLSQVDASIGGKLGVDFGAFKNHIGVFQLPVSTLIATDFLKTLPPRELRSGFAEIIKHCLIADKKMWETIRKRQLADQDWLKLVRHSVKIKSVVARKDPREAGLRKILNFGHTIGHALEGHFLNTQNRLFHGEAVAAGMVIESFIAFRKGLLKAADLEAIAAFIFSVFGKIQVPDDAQWLALLKQDKKNKGNTILLAVPKSVGKAIWDVGVSEKEIREATDYYRSRQT